MTNKRIDDFIKVASQRYDANPRGWEYLYNQLHSLLPKDDKEILEKQWYPISRKKELEEWDTQFLEATIDETKLAKQFSDVTDMAKQQKLYELYRQQQIAGMQNAATQSHTNGYIVPFGGSTSAAGALYPVQTDSSTTTSLWDKIIGRI